MQVRNPGFIALAILAAALGCDASSDAAEVTAATDTASRGCADSAAAAAAVVFPSDGAGDLEVSAEWLHEHRCGIRVIDLREAEELTGDLGHIEGAEAVPILSIPAAAATWDHDDPIVLAGGEGRRSRGAAVLLESMGFERVASLEGGMAAWVRAGFRVSRVEADLVRSVLPEVVVPDSEIREVPTWADSPELVPERIRQYFEGVDLRWVQVASLMLDGHENCVDGREEHHIIGTPGGDAGELLLLLATAERVNHQPLESNHIPDLLADYFDTFGEFYMHTDTHALEHLLRALHEDPLFADRVPEEGDVQHAELFLRHPPEDLRPALLEHLVEPHNVGCGHLRLVLEHPEEYGVRVELTRELIGAIYEALWARREELVYEVLRGTHQEGTVINVTVEAPIRAFTWVPQVRPQSLQREFFVNHPQVNAYLRRQRTLFLIDREPWMHISPNEEGAFVSAVEHLATVQLDASIGRLAPTLSIFDVHFEDRQISATQLR